MTGSACISALKALGDETRLRMLRLLSKAPLTVGEIVEKLGITQPNASKHLRVLREAGLIESEKQGQQRIYTIPEKLTAEIAANKGTLDLGCCTFRFDQLPK